MRAIHVVPAITQEGSGPSYSVVRLCESLVGLGNDVTLAAMDLTAARSAPAFVRLFPLGVGPLRAGRSPSMYRWLKAEVSCGSVDVVHSHGMWQMNAAYAGWVTSGKGARLIVSPRGAFSRWAMAHGSHFKKLFWPLVQRPALAQASCFHTTAETEYDDIRRLGFRQPVAFIPNGIDVPPLRRGSSAEGRTLLFLGRIHPVKGVDILLHAWSQVMQRHPDWQLSIVGTDAGYGEKTGYLNQMKALATHLRLRGVLFREAAYGAEKWETYSAADLFVLPTRSESFGMTVAEALAAGTPVIVTTAAPWSGLEAHQSGWWIAEGVEPLAAALDNAMRRSPLELAACGHNGRQWMTEEFSWRVIALRMDRTYRWLMEGGEVPPWVTTN